MLEATFTKQFEKDVKLAQRRGKDLQKMKEVVQFLLENKLLAAKYRDHWLTGTYVNRRECHLAPDWLLIYEPRKHENQIIFERLGTHSDLFK